MRLKLHQCIIINKSTATKQRVDNKTTILVAGLKDTLVLTITDGNL